MLRFIYTVCFLLLVTSQALAKNPIDGAIDDPVFIETPSFRSGAAENKNSISLNFDMDRKRCRAYYGNSYYSPCRPRLNLKGKEAVAGISISPEITGEWRWDNDYRLTFTPEEHWLAGQNYVVDIDLDALQVPERVIFPKGQRKAAKNIKTRPLQIEINEMRYMQDPDDPLRKLVVARLDANYPVVSETLHERINLTLEKEDAGQILITDKGLSYELELQSNQTSANLAVPIKKLPEQDLYLQLTIPPGVQPAFGGQLSSREFKERARVPSLSTYLALTSSSAVIARQEDGTPGQILSLEANVKASPEAVLDKATLYLLPFNHPVMGRIGEDESETPYRWQAANELTPSILEQSEKISLKPMPEPDENVTRFGFGFKAPAGRYLYVAIDKGLKAFGGYTLEKRYEAILQVPAYPHDIEIMQEGSILTLSGAKKLSLHARGTDRLQIEVAQILPEALQHFISQTRGDIRTPSFRHWSFDKDDIAQIDTQDIKMAYVSPYESQYASFDFAPYLQDDRKGIFLLNIQGFKDDKFTGKAAQRFVLVTDMGLLVKHNADQSRDVFLISFQNGRPVEKADISVLGKNGLEIFMASTDSQGHVSLPDFSGYSQDRQPVAIVAKKGDDFAFIPYDRQDRKLNMSRFDVGGTHIAAQGLDAFLFSDRGIYRPGETAHIGMIVKNADWQVLPPMLPLKTVITDPRGRIVKEELISFSSPGIKDISLETEKAWPTGTYFVHLYIADDGEQGSLLGSTSVRVEEFQPDRLKIKTEFAQNDEKIDFEQGWLKPEGLKLETALTNLYGTPASNRKIRAKVSLNPARLSFKTYPAYIFFDPYAAKPRTVNYDLPSVETDREGHASIPLNLAFQERATYSLTVEATGYEAGSGKGVTAYSTALVSPMDYAVGYQSDANLGYLGKGKNYTLDLKAVSPRLAPVPVNDLSLVLLKKTYVSTLVKRRNGSYVYESVPKEEALDATDFSIAKNGTALKLPTANLGDFIYRLKTKEGLVVADIPFSVAGEGQRKGGLDREAVLKVKTDKTDYGAGEKIELNISAPYTGAGLITLESDRVLAHKWFQTDKTETVQSIKIPEDFAGKGYVNVAFVRDINAREIYLSPLSNAVVPFTANTQSRSIEVDFALPEIAKPGEPLEIKYRGNKKGKAVIFAVDEGILQVAGYKTPNPVDHFLLNRALQVQTSQMLDLLMPEYALIRELSADGGGAALENAVLGKHLNPFRRKILAPAVYWSGIVDLDEKEKTLSFIPPGHFNGQLRIMAVAVGDGNVGSAAQKITVRSDIVLTPNMPLFLAPQDRAEASVTIANGLDGSGESAEIFIKLEPSAGLSIIQAPPETVKIPEGEEQSFTFTLKASEALGPASLIIRAGAGGVEQSAEATLSIRPAVPRETTMKAGYAKDGQAKIILERDLYTEFAEKDVSVSALPTAYIYGLLRYLDGFPYGCTEQITSRIYPQVSLINMPEFSFSEDEIRSNVGAAVSTLRRRQTQDGGFTLWNGGYEPDDFISVYAMDFLTQAQHADMPVPTDLVQRGLSYLRNWANQNIKSMNDARNKAYAIYILTRSGMVTTNEILHWLQYFEEKKTDNWQTDLSAVYIAAAYEMMQQKNLAKQAMDDFEKGVFADKVSYKDTDWNKPYYNPFVKYAQYVSILSRHFPARFKALDANVVFKLADFLQLNRYNTLSASYAIQALSDYASLQDETLEQSNIVVQAEGRSLPLSGAQILNTSLPLDISRFEITNGKKSFIGFGGSAEPFFYTVTETGYSRGIGAGPVTEGLEIERIYQNEDGEPVTEALNIGDIIEAVIKVRSYDDLRIENVAIVDLLPGGLVLEPESNNAGSTLFPEFVDRREDRIIIFADINPYEQVFRYRLRAVTKGEFQVPPPYAEAMYDLTKKAKGTLNKIVIRDENQ